MLYLYLKDLHVSHTCLMMCCDMQWHVNKLLRGYYAFCTLWFSVILHRTSFDPKNRGLHCCYSILLCLDLLVRKKHNPIAEGRGIEKASVDIRNECKTGEKREHWKAIWREGGAKEVKGTRREVTGEEIKSQRSAERQWVVLSHSSFQDRWRKRHKLGYWKDF